MKKGTHHSEETRRKIGAAQLGKPKHSLGARRRMSELRKGTRLGSDHPMWRGGRSKQRGYVVVHTAEGRVFEHRLLMAERVARPLRAEETVHHVNEVRDDNHPENLWLFADKASHAAWHEMCKRGGDLRVRMAPVALA